MLFNALYFAHDRHDSAVALFMIGIMLVMVIIVTTAVVGGVVVTTMVDEVLGVPLKFTQAGSKCVRSGVREEPLDGWAQLFNRSVQKTP